MATPKQWLETQLRYVCAFEYGKSLPADSRRAGRFPVFGSNGVVGYHDTALVSGPGIVIGRKGSIGEIAWSTSDFWPIDTTYYIRLKESTDLRWLFHLLQQLGLRSLNTATGIPGLNRDVALNLLVGIPPLPEQKKIAAVLSSVDAAIEKTEAVIAQLQVVKKAMMEQLLTKGMPGRHTRFKQTDLGEIPEEWTIRTIGELARLSGGHGFRPPDWRTEGLPIIRIQNLNGSKSFNYYDGPVDSSWLVEPGELLFAWAGSRGASFGPKVWPGPKGLLNQHIYRVTPNSDVNADFLFLQLLRLTAEIEKKAHGFKDTLLHLQKHELTGFRVALPMLTEQREICAALSAIEQQCTCEENVLQSVLQMRNSLRTSLLSGELRVPTESVPCPV